MWTVPGVQEQQMLRPGCGHMAPCMAVWEARSVGAGAGEPHPGAGHCQDLTGLAAQAPVGLCLGVKWEPQKVLEQKSVRDDLPSTRMRAAAVLSSA